MAVWHGHGGKNLKPFSNSTVHQQDFLISLCISDLKEILILKGTPNGNGPIYAIN
jgi:hypothetical protein